MLTAFLDDPEPFPNGSRRLAGNVASTAARPVTSWIAGALGRLVSDTRWLLVVVLLSPKSLQDPALLSPRTCHEPDDYPTHHREPNEGVAPANTIPQAVSPDVNAVKHRCAGYARAVLTRH